jgi:hypothetical protein
MDWSPFSSNRGVGAVTVGGLSTAIRAFAVKGFHVASVGVAL